MMCCGLRVLFVWWAVFGTAVCSSNHHEMTTEEGTSFDLQIVLDPQVTPISPILPPDFVSLSLEWGKATASLLPKLPTFRTLIQELLHPVAPDELNADAAAAAATGHGTFHKAINIRVGGNSADRTVWSNDTAASSTSTTGHPPAQFSLPPPQGDMTPDTLLGLYHVARAVGNVTLILDLTMRQASPQEAIEEYQGILRTLGLMDDFHTIVEGLEIGNEADLFAGHGLRKPDYSPKEFLQEFSQYIQQIEKAAAILYTSNVTNTSAQQNHGLKQFLQGGTFCCRQEFLDAQPLLMEQFRGYLRSWSFHRYPTSTCKHSTTSIEALLSDRASDGQASLVQDWANYAQTKLHIPFHMGETNSASCGGQWGVSDTLASSLWSFDYLMAMATHNVSRVNFHGGDHGPYTWFSLNDPHKKNANNLDVRPLYYGMFAWNWMTVHPGSRIIPLRIKYPGDAQMDHDGKNRTSTTKSQQWCSKGIPYLQEVCCAKKCGTCGGSGCNRRPGGAALCCSNEIERRGIRCETPHDVGCLLPSYYRSRGAKAWAVVDGAGNSKIAVINKHLDKQSTTNRSNSTTTIELEIRVPKSAGYRPEAELVVLKARDGAMTAIRHLSFAGWTWEGSRGGERKGHFQSTTLHPQECLGQASQEEFVYVVSQPPATIFIVSFQKRDTQFATDASSAEPMLRAT